MPFIVGDLIPLAALIAAMPGCATTITDEVVVVWLVALRKASIIHWGVIVLVVLALIPSTFPCFLLVIMVFLVKLVVAEEIHNGLDVFGILINSPGHCSDKILEQCAVFGLVTILEQ